MSDHDSSLTRLPPSGSSSADTQAFINMVQAIYSLQQSVDALTAQFPSLTGQILGTTTNDAAAAGRVGELLSTTVLQAGALALTTNTALNIATLSLTAGDWDLSGVGYILGAATTNFTYGEASIGPTTITRNNVAGAFSGINLPAAGVVPVGLLGSFLVPPQRISLAATTTYYLVAYATFTVSTASVFGQVRARRVR